MDIVCSQERKKKKWRTASLFKCVTLSTFRYFLSMKWLKEQKDKSFLRSQITEQKAWGNTKVWVFLLFVVSSKSVALNWFCFRTHIWTSRYQSSLLYKIDFLMLSVANNSPHIHPHCKLIHICCSMGCILFYLKIFFHSMSMLFGYSSASFYQVRGVQSWFWRANVL